MAEKFNSDLKLSPKDLAKHLKKPDGEIGKHIGLQMNSGNKHICLNTYAVLNPKEKDNILEIGMGNGFFIPQLLEKNNHLKYTGLDFSETMIKEASVLNSKLIKSKKVHLVHGSIEKLPFPNDHFDCVTTTNTLYFWPQPKANAQELLRVLKPQGRVVIAYRPKSIMDQLELAAYGFAKYNPGDAEQLLLEAGFACISSQVITEPPLEFEGTEIVMEGVYTQGVKK